MRLLIVTQAVDRTDLSLGFFHAWAAEFARRVERLEIVCLREGEHDLPWNVSVHSLGKERSRGPHWYKRVRYGLRFLGLIVALRGRYDIVLVHMNEEYVLLGIVPWFFMRKRVGLWRNHVRGNWKAAIACRVVPAVFYTSPNTYATRFTHAYRMPTGIEVEKYAAGENAPGTLLSLGRIDPVKKVAELLSALELLEKEGAAFTASIYGTPTPGREAYAQGLESLFSRLEARGVLARYPGVPHEKVPAIFGSHRIFVNLTPPGSFDKTVFEAMAAGCLVVAANPGVREVIGEELFVPTIEAASVAKALKQALAMPQGAYEMKRAQLRAYVEREHSLKALVGEVLGHLKRLSY